MPLADLDKEGFSDANARDVLKFLKARCDTDVTVSRETKNAKTRIRKYRGGGLELEPGHGFTEDEAEEEDGDEGEDPNRDWPGARPPRGALGQQLLDRALGGGDKRGPVPRSKQTPLPRLPARRAPGDNGAFGRTLVSSLLGEKERLAPVVLEQVELFYGRSFTRFGESAALETTRNQNELVSHCFQLDVWAQELGFERLYESDAVEVAVRRILAVCEADKARNWKVAAYYEIVPRKTLVIPDSIRKAARKQATEDEILRKGSKVTSCGDGE